MTALPPEQAIERHLARRLSKVREFGLAGPHELAEACSAVEALERAGGLSAEDAAEWSRRIVRTAQGPGPGDPQRRARALDFVADLVSREGGDRARVVAEAFRRLGLLSDQDELALLWPSLLDEDIEDDVDAFRGAGGFRDDRPLRVVPGPSQRVGGLRVTVIELFAAAVSVHWHFDSRLARGGTGEELKGLMEERSPFATRLLSTKEVILRMALPLIGLRDDSGGDDYTGFRCDQVSSNPDVIGSSGFVPGPPETAERLAVMIGEMDLWVEL